MWTSSVEFSALQARGRWKVEFFCSPESGKVGSSCDTLTPISRLVRERKESVEPCSLGDTIVNYVGLEHIQSLTGELVQFSPRPANSIKSRSKVFKQGDVLYGRLRPNLNKVWLASLPAAEGICSTEFFVLVPNEALVLPFVLRYLLSSHYVQRHASRLQTGTALPRMNLEDLLEIEVPVPPMAVQETLEKQLRQRFEELIELRRQVDSLPTTIIEEFLAVVEAPTVV